jgi:beta-phosphoglucomutase-like phosphatase (HAD superfamily)
VYLSACAGLGVDPADALAVEDSQSGLLAGLAAGMMVAAVPDPRARPPAALDRAHVVLPDLHAFAALWDGPVCGVPSGDDVAVSSPPASRRSPP